MKLPKEVQTKLRIDAPARSGRQPPIAYSTTPRSMDVQFADLCQEYSAGSGGGVSRMDTILEMQLETVHSLGFLETMDLGNLKQELVEIFVALPKDVDDMSVIEEVIIHNDGFRMDRKFDSSELISYANGSLQGTGIEILPGTPDGSDYMIERWDGKREVEFVVNEERIEAMISTPGDFLAIINKRIQSEGFMFLEWDTKGDSYAFVMTRIDAYVRMKEDRRFSFFEPGDPRKK